MEAWAGISGREGQPPLKLRLMLTEAAVAEGRTGGTDKVKIKITMIIIMILEGLKRAREEENFGVNGESDGFGFGVVKLIKMVLKVNAKVRLCYALRSVCLVVC